MLHNELFGQSISPVTGNNRCMMTIQTIGNYLIPKMASSSYDIALAVFDIFHSSLRGLISTCSTNLLKYNIPSSLKSQEVFHYNYIIYYMSVVSILVIQSKIQLQVLGFSGSLIGTAQENGRHCQP